MNSIVIPGSKSYTNRALLVAALTQGTVTITRACLADDTFAMIRGLQQLGIEIVQDDACIKVVGDISHVRDGSYDLDVDLSGITLRFLLALSCILPGCQTIYGKDRLNRRPIGPLVDALTKRGAQIEYLGREGFPPVRVHSSKLQPGSVLMDSKLSSQYLSALLLVAPLIDGDLSIDLVGGVTSKPYVDMTLDTMAACGITFTREGYTHFHVPGKQTYTLSSYEVEGDISSASYFFAIGALTHSKISVHNVNPASKQPDMQLLHFLEMMGSEVIYGKESITVVGHGVQPLSIDMQDCPDQAMTMGVLAAFAEGTTQLHGIQTLRIKECDRVFALEQELAKIGIKTESTESSLKIYGGKPKSAHIDTYGDHRMAMAFAVAQTLIPGMRINAPEVVSKSFPQFWDILRSITLSNTVLIGMRGSGKSSIGRLLAQRLGKDFYDMDEEICKRAGLSIHEFVIRHGWQAFRDLESLIAQEASQRVHTVIATGGGTILRPENVQTLKQNGSLYLLIADPSTLATRLAGDTTRPPLTNHGSCTSELEAVWLERQPAYYQAADRIISTQDRPPQHIVDEIVKSHARMGV